MEKATYKNSGVDLDVYAESMSRLPKLVSRTFSPRVLRLDGGFAGLFQLNGLSKDGGVVRKYDDPVLVSCTDGVGTKIKIACMTNRHSDVGIDLVAMSVNDAICCGAEPLFCLDYVACPKDDPDLLEILVSGIARACEEVGCALIGGETAILSGMYNPGEYDLAGFCVGVAERSKIIDGKSIQDQDLLIGIASSGCHSNGFSLIRQVVFDIAGLRPDDYVPELGKTVADELLTPTRLYVRPALSLLEKFGANDGIRGIAHITGGGLVENLSRILPNGLQCEITPDSWDVLPVFKWLQKLGSIDASEMERVFNMGLGLVLVVRPDVADAVCDELCHMGLRNFKIGRIVRKET